MDYLNQMSRRSEQYERKQKLQLISHSQLKPQQLLPDSTPTFMTSSSAPSTARYHHEHSSPSTSKQEIHERWKQEIKEKRLKAELKGFTSIHKN